MDLQLPDPAAYVCDYLQTRTQHAGFAVRDLVQVGQHKGRVFAFACRDGQPAAWLELPIPGAPERATVQRLVPLAELRKVAA